MIRAPRPERVFPTATLYQPDQQAFYIVKSDKSIKADDKNPNTLKAKLYSRKLLIDPFDVYGIYRLLDEKISGSVSLGQANLISAIYYLYKMDEKMKKIAKPSFVASETK